MPFDFTLLKDVPIVSDAVNAKYALVVSETSNSQNNIKKQAVEKLDTNLLKSDYIDVTNDFIQNNDIRRDRLAAFPFELPFLLKVKKYGAYVRLVV